MFLSSIVTWVKGTKTKTMFIFMMHDTYLDRVRKQLCLPREMRKALKLNRAVILWAKGDNVTTEF